MGHQGAGRSRVWGEPGRRAGHTAAARGTSQAIGERQVSDRDWMVFDLATEIEKLQASGSPYAEFLRVPDLSCGVYKLPAGAKDMQGPHDEDEVYFVVDGRGRLQVGRRGAIRAARLHPLRSRHLGALLLRDRGRHGRSWSSSPRGGRASRRGYAWRRRPAQDCVLGQPPRRCSPQRNLWAVAGVPRSSCLLESFRRRWNRRGRSRCPGKPSGRGHCPRPLASW